MAADAAMLRHSLGDLGTLTPTQRSEWAPYINSFQAADGSFTAPGANSDSVTHESCAERRISRC